MPKAGYHHGNLRQALVDAALLLVEEKGPTGFTLSEAAKRAGVTPAAVYRHFEGRVDLIAECALQGFRIFGDLMEHAFAGGETPLAAFEATGRAYIAFARKHPGHYVAMFESGISLNRTPDLFDASQRGTSVLEKASAQLCLNLPADRRPPPQMFANHIWALSHGVVELFARGNKPANCPIPPEDLLESGIGIYLRGLGIIEADR